MLSNHITVLFIFDLFKQKHPCLTLNHYTTKIGDNEKACLLKKEKYQPFNFDQMEHQRIMSVKVYLAIFSTQIA